MAGATVTQATDREFVNSIRFWSMVAIVAVHALYLWGDFTVTAMAAAPFQIALVQCCKFATPAFFIISGFLLGDRLPKSSALLYFQRRLNKIGLPWLFWAATFSLFFVLRYDLAVQSPLQAVLFRVKETLFYSIYWFVPNSLLSLGILLMCRRVADRLWFGALLFSVSLFWGCNAYLHWLPVAHTAALSAYVSYLWLGRWANGNYAKVTALLEKLSYPLLLSAVALTGLLSCGETVLLNRLGTEANESTIRISNQIFSIFAVLLLAKARPAYPSFINVRTETFGIYLIHPLTLLVTKATVAAVHVRLFGRVIFSDAQIWSHPAAALAYWALAFVMTYGLSLVATKWLVVHRFGFLIGAQSPKHAEAEKPFEPMPIPQQVAA